MPLELPDYEDGIVAACAKVEDEAAFCSACGTKKPVEQKGAERLQEQEIWRP